MTNTPLLPTFEEKLEAISPSIEKLLEVADKEAVSEVVDDYLALLMGFTKSKPRDKSPLFVSSSRGKVVKKVYLPDSTQES